MTAYTGSGIYYSAVRLRWNYQTVHSDAPRQFNGEHRSAFGYDPSRHTDPTQEFSQFTPAEGGQHYWMSAEPSSADEGISVGATSTSHSTYAIRAAIPKAGTNEWIEGPERTIAPLTWDSINAQPIWDDSTKCNPDNWPAAGLTSEPVGGPGALAPGHWITKDKDESAPGIVTGWRFYWTSAIEFDQATGTFGLSYDLLAFWYTYQLVDGVWSPVWLYSRMQALEQSAGDFVEGAMIYPVKGGDDLVVGNVRIFFNDPESHASSPIDDHQHAWVDLSVNGSDGLNANIQFQIRDILLDGDLFDPNDFGHPNPSTHFRGVWIEGEKTLFDQEGRILHDSSLIMSEWTDTSMTSMTIQSFDDNEVPIWFIYSFCDQSGPGSKCNPDYRPDIAEYVHEETFHAFHPATDPFFTADDKEAEKAVRRSLDPALQTGGYGVKRLLRGAPVSPDNSSFDPKLDFTEGSLCVNLQGPFGNRPFHINLGDPYCNGNNIRTAGAKISKIANFHDIDFLLPNAQMPEDESICNLADAGEGRCELLLTWFTDDYNPDAQPMYSTATDGTYRHIDELCVEETGTQFDFAVVQMQCNIVDADIYGSEIFRFHLVNNPSPGGGYIAGQSAVIATSRALEIFGATEAPIESPPEVVVPTPPLPDANSSRTGATRGDFNVSHLGAAEYTVPIMTAPGSGGVAPELALSYNSMSGEGPMGPGWEISGFSTITRCGQTYEQDGITTGVTLTSADRFCLDGQRLIQVSGVVYGEPDSRYRLEIDTFVRITAKGDIGGFPQFFEIESKDGSTSTFGSRDPSGSSAVRIPDRQGAAIYAWPISRFEDSVGNYITFEYFQPGRNSPQPWIEWLPEIVRYTGNVDAGQSPYATIAFEYSQLAGSATTGGYLSGVGMKRTQRLERVKSKAESSLLREYRIQYTENDHGQRLVKSLEECWGSAHDDCYGSLEIKWYQGVPEIGNSYAVSGISSFKGFWGAVSGDLSGDGRQEIVMIRSHGSGKRAGVDVIRNIGSEQANLITSASLQQVGCAGLKASNLRSPLIVDLDGDGVGGLVYVATVCDVEDDVGVYYHPWDPEGGTLSSASIRIAGLPGSPEVGTLQLNAMDLSGDGMVDLLLTSNFPDSKGSSSFGWVYRNQLIPGQVSVGDPEIVTIQYDENYLPRPPIGGPGEPTLCPPGDSAETKDFIKHLKFPRVAVDQSGRTAIGARVTRHLYCFQKPHSTGIARTEANSFDVLFEKSFIFQIIEGESGLRAAVWDPIDGMSAKHVYAVDLNSDGYTDFVSMRESIQPGKVTANIYLNDGTKLLEPVASISVDEELGGLVHIFDYTGDGVPDFLTPESASEDNAQWCINRGFRSSSGELRFHPNRVCDGPKAGNANAGSQTLFVDFWGNAVTDVVSILGRGGNIACMGGASGDYCVYAGQGTIRHNGGSQELFTPSNKIRSFTDGFGAWTKLEYGSLAQPQVHRRDSGSGYQFGRGSAVFDFVMPMYVVTAATSLSPHHKLNGAAHGAQHHPEGEARIDYFYRGAKIQAGGRGFLGFRQAASFDADSGVLSVTEYKQDFPFVGRPSQTSTLYYPGGVAPWRVENWDFSGQIEPYCCINS